MTIGNLPNLSVPRLSPFYSSDNNSTSLTGLQWMFKEITFILHSVLYLMGSIHFSCLFPCYSWVNWGSEQSINLINTAMTIKGKGWLWTQVVLLLNFVLEYYTLFLQRAWQPNISFHTVWVNIECVLSSRVGMGQLPSKTLFPSSTE